MTVEHRGHVRAAGAADGSAGHALAKLSLIVVNYRSLSYTTALVEQLVNAVDEVIVVENGSGDSLDALGRRHPQVTVLELPENRGYGAGANAGAARATGDVLVFANPDIDVAPSDVRRLAEAARVPGVGLVAPKYVDANGSLLRSAYRREPRFLQTFFDVAVPLRFRLARWRPDWHPTLLSSRDHETQHDVVHVLGALNAVNAVAFRAVGGFDESFFMYREETDLCRRLRREGWRVRHFPEAVAVHHGGASTPSEWYEPGHPQMIDSHYRYIAKHWGRTTAFLARALAVATLLVWLAGAGDRRYVLAYLRGHAR